MAVKRREAVVSPGLLERSSFHYLRRQKRKVWPWNEWMNGTILTIAMMTFCRWKNTEERLHTLRTLSLFTIEVRKKDGSKYPPASIHLLLCGLQHIMRHNNRCPFDIFDKKDVRFSRYNGICVSVTTQRGVGAEEKHIPLITKEEEATMWEKGFDSASSGEKCILLEWEKLLDLLRTI